ncbi:MAG: DUF4147 domain-containing protein, partial [Chloroflexota bacterium]
MGELLFRDCRAHLNHAMEAALRAADPQARLLAHLPALAEPLERARHCWALGFGKASLEMALALQA